jgi:hypothetical protein
VDVVLKLLDGARVVVKGIDLLVHEEETIDDRVFIRELFA